MLAEGFAVSEWLLIYVEPRPIQETHCILKSWKTVLSEDCTLKLL